MDPRLSAPALRDALLAARNHDGGWPYYPQHDSRLEPTVWALLALAREANRPVDLDAISHWPRTNGWFVDGPASAPVNYAFNALAAIACLGQTASASIATGVAGLLVAAKGISLDQSDVQRQDNSLQAWPWINQTFSWVEPTAWCTLLLKKCRHMNLFGAADKTDMAQAAARIDVAERLIRDRVCHDGGWNYGGSNVYGQELYPYVPTTAIALLAMQDRRTDPAVVKSIGWLKANATKEPTTEAIGLTVMCLSVYGLAVDALRAPLAAAIDVSHLRGNVLGMAMALYAVSDGNDAMAAFRV